MKLTLNNFFDRLIFNPFAATKTSEKVTSLLASVALLVFTLGICHVTCAIRKCCWTHKPSGTRMNSTEVRTTQQAQSTLVRSPTPPPASIISPQPPAPTTATGEVSLPRAVPPAEVKGSVNVPRPSPVDHIIDIPDSSSDDELVAEDRIQAVDWKMLGEYQMPLETYKALQNLLSGYISDFMKLPLYHTSSLDKDAMPVRSSMTAPVMRGVRGNKQLFIAIKLDCTLTDENIEKFPGMVKRDYMDGRNSREIKTVLVLSSDAEGFGWKQLSRAVSAKPTFFKDSFIDYRTGKGPTIESKEGFECLRDLLTKRNGNDCLQDGYTKVYNRQYWTIPSN